MRSTDKTIVAVLVLVVVAVGGYFLLVNPKHNQANRLKSEIASEQQALTQAESQVQAGETAEAEYRTYAKQLKAISAAVPSDEQIPELINELQSASDKNDVGFQEVSVAGASQTATTAVAGSTASTTAAFPSQSFSLTFTGDYYSVSGLLGTLASFVRADDKHFKASGRLITISSVSLAPGSSTGTGTISTTVSEQSGDVTATVSALDYDIPTVLNGTSAGG